MVNYNILDSVDAKLEPEIIFLRSFPKEGLHSLIPKHLLK